MTPSNQPVCKVNAGVFNKKSSFLFDYYLMGQNAGTAFKLNLSQVPL